MFIHKLKIFFLIVAFALCQGCEADNTEQTKFMYNFDIKNNSYLYSNLNSENEIIISSSKKIIKFYTDNKNIKIEISKLSNDAKNTYILTSDKTNNSILYSCDNGNYICEKIFSLNVIITNFEILDNKNLYLLMRFPYEKARKTELYIYDISDKKFTSPPSYGNPYSGEGFPRNFFHTGDKEFIIVVSDLKNQNCLRLDFSKSEENVFNIKRMQLICDDIPFNSSYHLDQNGGTIEGLTLSGWDRKNNCPKLNDCIFYFSFDKNKMFHIKNKIDNFILQSRFSGKDKISIFKNVNGTLFLEEWQINFIDQSSVLLNKTEIKDLDKSTILVLLN